VSKMLLDVWIRSDVDDAVTKYSSIPEVIACGCPVKNASEGMNNFRIVCDSNHEVDVCKILEVDKGIVFYDDLGEIP
jgi:hypothetical protein